MLSLLLLATVPVLLGVGAGGYAWLRFGSTGLWVGLASAGLAAVLFWALRSAGGTFAEQVLAPIAVYFPALLLGGAVLVLRGRHRWTAPGIGFLAVGMALLNVWLAQVFFIAGCAADWWVCP